MESVRFGAFIDGHMRLHFVDCEKLRHLSKDFRVCLSRLLFMNLHKSRRIRSSDMLLRLNSCNSHLEALFGVVFHWHRWYYFIFSHNKELKIIILTITDD